MGTFQIAARTPTLEAHKLACAQRVVSVLAAARYIHVVPMGLRKQRAQAVGNN